MATNLRDIIDAHAVRYPLWRVEDLYKLLHQSAMGCEHAVTDKATAQERLSLEWQSMGPGPEEPLIDPISPDGAIVRVHLRPYARQGLDQALLLGAFLRTARDFLGAAERIESYSRIAVSLAGVTRLTISAETITGFFGKMREMGFPATHHSPEYQEHYRPAYRVIAGGFLHPDILEVGRDRTDAVSSSRGD